MQESNNHQKLKVFNTEWVEKHFFTGVRSIIVFLICGVSFCIESFQSYMSLYFKT
jgi:hypothetical protein